MKKNMSTPQEGQMPGDDELKKLRKREQRALERLQEARKAQTRALERFQRAEARLQKRSARLQRIEGRLTLLRQQLEHMPGLGSRESDEAQLVSQTQPVADPSTAESRLAPAPEANVSSTAVPSTSSDAPTPREESEQPSNDARAAAEATEENVRLAAARANGIADAASETALPEADAGPQPGEIAEMPQQPETHTTPEEIAIIEEEEELTAAVTAETIAHITAERAAKAEVIAEISSKQTREARRYVQDAEQALIEVRTAISNGVLSGEEAQEALWRAEHAVTRAQAFLADAEANEEQAVKAAMNAEADAEVAEGMAFASADHVALLAIADEQPGSEETQSSMLNQEHTPENDDESDITTKISVTQPREQA